MGGTGYKDINGWDIKLSDRVEYRGDIYDVYVNPFTHRVVLDNEQGQIPLAEAHMECEVVYT